MDDKGRDVPQDYAEAVKWYRKATEQGFAEARTRLGNMYFRGQNVPKDYVLAHMWFLSCSLAIHCTEKSKRKRTE